MTKGHRVTRVCVDCGQRKEQVRDRMSETGSSLLPRATQIRICRTCSAVRWAATRAALGGRP
jgi:hypothetical protein